MQSFSPSIQLLCCRITLVARANKNSLRKHSSITAIFHYGFFNKVRTHFTVVRQRNSFHYIPFSPSKSNLPRDSANLYISRIGITALAAVILAFIDVTNFSCNFGHATLSADLLKTYWPFLGQSLFTPTPYKKGQLCIPRLGYSFINIIIILIKLGLAIRHKEIQLNPGA